MYLKSFVGCLKGKCKGVVVLIKKDNMVVEVFFINCYVEKLVISGYIFCVLFLYEFKFCF